jgi:hypothetical protein
MKKRRRLSISNHVWASFHTSPEAVCRTTRNFPAMLHGLPTNMSKQFQKLEKPNIGITDHHYCQQFGGMLAFDGNSS